jgi:hypothetical protein
MGVAEKRAALKTILFFSMPTRSRIVHQMKMWLGGAVAIALLAGVAFLNNASLSPSRADAAAQPELKKHWRYHDGHWNYWDEGDKRWYYTDGSQWYYRDNDAWKVYRFDKGFGRDGFERGEYRAPAEGAKVVVPNHGVYVPR